tara:strand:- start:246 stop:578 length:333 start_codon:yes stop_codon:yes gene_type:complete
MEIDLEYIENVLIPECNKNLISYKNGCGHSTIYGDELTLDVKNKWIYLRGTGKKVCGKHYTYLKIKIEDQGLYSSSGKKSMCHYKDKDGPKGWSKLRAYFVTQKEEGSSN